MKNLTYILIALLFSSVSAGENGGTQSPFSFGFGARELSLGGSNITNPSAATAVFWNSSQLSEIELIEFTGYYSRLYDNDVAYQYIGLGYPTLDYGSFGIGISRLGISGIEKRDASNFYLGEFEDSRVGIYLGYGKKLSNYNLGFSISTEHHSIDTYKSTSSPGLSFSLNRGILMKHNILKKIVSLVQVSNLLKPSMKLANQSIKYPTEFIIGFTSELSFNNKTNDRLNFYTKINKIDDISTKFAFGLEYSFYDMLNLRYGLRENHSSYGVGIDYRNIKFDYALVDRDFGNIHMFSLTSAVGKSVVDKRKDRDKKETQKFNNLMQQRLEMNNQAMIVELTNVASEQLINNNLKSSLQNYERALFLMKANSIDTIEVATLIDSIKLHITKNENEQSYSFYLDSAQVKLSNKQFIEAKYFSNMALQIYPGRVTCLEILDTCNFELALMLDKTELLQIQLLNADSLIEYGNIAKAEIILNELIKSNSSNKSVKRLFTKVKFEKLMDSAENSFNQKDIETANTYLKAAEILFPGHIWCIEFAQILKEFKNIPEESINKEKNLINAPKLSEKMQKEISSIYAEAQNQFELGNLQLAIQQWIKVESISPNYKLVRQYLVNAYKYVGVEYYGNNELKQAVAVWKKAEELAPSNEEIKNYIKRAINELNKMKELTYGEK